MPGLVIGKSGSYVGEGWIGDGSSAQTIACNQVTETDLAQAIAWAPKKRLVNQVTETDLAQAITIVKRYAVAQVTETDTAQALTKIKNRTTAQVTETDTPQPISKTKQKGIGQVTETDLAQSIAKAIGKSVAQVVETDLAQSITIQKIKAIAQVTETDLAQSIGKQKFVAVGQAVETDLAQPIIESGPQVVAVGQATETDIAQPINIVIIPASIGPGWLGGGPVVRKRKAWPLPPPAFPIVEETPEVLALGKTEPIPKWVKVIESKPIIKPGGTEYIPPAPVESRPKRIPRRIQAKIEEYKVQGPTADEIIREWKRKEEEEVVMALIMQGEL